ncbi:MAG: hypothetical protein ACOC92_01215 [bacterium]
MGDGTQQSSKVGWLWKVGAPLIGGVVLGIVVAHFVEIGRFAPADRMERLLHLEGGRVELVGEGTGVRLGVGVGRMAAEVATEGRAGFTVSALAGDPRLCFATLLHSG